MANSSTLSDQDSTFFRQLEILLSGNPFAVSADQPELLQHSRGPERGGQHVFEELVEPVEQRLRDLRQRGLRALADLSGQRDRSLLATAYLFQSYSFHLEAFDALIETETAGEPSNPQKFAESVIAELCALGFSEPLALRHFEQFYQLRRAYYFIDRSLVGNSAPMRRLRFDLWNSVFSYDIKQYDSYLHARMEDFSTLLVGETGVGKGAAAAAVGRSGYIPFDRATGRFRYPIAATFNAINLAEFPESLIESELFGHRKGAFTGAVDHYSGVFGDSHPSSTLFLDEIGDASLNIQLKLLRVLQERRFTPVGSREAARFSGRVIAATNRNVDELRRDGLLRDDFYYRLSANVIAIPPLRERISEDAGELKQMVNALLRRMVAKPDDRLVDQLLRTLAKDLPADYLWTGNVRELEQAIRRILLTQHYHGDRVGAAVTGDDDWFPQLRAGELTANEVLGRYCLLLYRRYNNFQEVARRTGLDRRTVQKYCSQVTAE